MSDWFTSLTGFRERPWPDTQALLEVEGQTLRSRVNGRAFAIGTLETPSVGDLRRLGSVARATVPGRPRVSVVQADVSALHADPANRHSVFQVASQFNLLEMVAPGVTPEHGVTRYADDKTQGPACAIAAGAATIYRNYFHPVDGLPGQTSTRQVDCLRQVGEALCNAEGALWAMRNGYALCTHEGLVAIDARLRAMSRFERDALRDCLRVGVHWDVQVTAADDIHQRVSQVLCSALPVSYSALPPSAPWEAFATLVLEGAYEATLWAAVLNAARTSSRVVWLTQVGGGAFGNEPSWIYQAIRRALHAVREADLDVRIVSRSVPGSALRELATDFGG